LTGRIAPTMLVRMSATRESFLQAIIEAPEDDTPRLVFADWLDDQGDEHSVMQAAFIRAQITRAKLRWPWVDPETWEACEEREKGYLQWHGLAGVRELRKVPAVSWGFRRGFIGVMTVESLSTFQEYALAGLEKFPLEEVRFVPRGGRSSVPSTGPRTARAIDAAIYAGNVATLAAEPLLARFRRLDLWGNPLGDDGARAFLESPHLASLRALRLAQTGLRAEGVAAVAATPALAALEELDLSDNHIGTRGAQALAESPHLKGLSWLVLIHCKLDYRSRAADQLRQEFGDGLRW
jgi:uncharacterized protein (TIGR02996 family)